MNLVTPAIFSWPFWKLEGQLDEAILAYGWLFGGNSTGFKAGGDACSEWLVPISAEAKFSCDGRKSY